MTMKEERISLSFLYRTQVILKEIKVVMQVLIPPFVHHYSLLLSFEEINETYKRCLAA